MQPNQAQAAPHTPSPAALKALHDAIGKAEAWQHRMGGLIKQIAQDVAHPAKSMYHLWSIQLLPTADLSQAEVHLQAAVVAESHLTRAIDDMKKPDFIAQDHAKIEKTGHDVSTNMAQARQEIRMAANAVYEANMKVLNRDVGVASGFVAADKFIVDKAPEVMGDIVFIISDGNAHARTATINLGKTALNGVEHVSANVQGIKLDKKDVPDFADVALDAAIDELADWVPEGKGIVKKVLTEMFKNICVEIAKTCRGKHGKELQTALLKAVNDGVMESVDKLAKEIPALKNSKLAEKLTKPVLKAAIAFEKAMVDDGKTPAEAAKEALKKGGETVLVLGTERVAHNAKDYHEPSSDNHPAHPNPHRPHSNPTHPSQTHSSSGHPGDHDGAHGHAVPGHGSQQHPHHERHATNSGHHGSAAHAQAGRSSQAAKDAWLLEILKIDAAAHHPAS